MNRVNIILAAYNGEKYIGEQIDSILNNSFTDWNLWIFDDGSSDGTGTIVNGYVLKHPNKINYICNASNKGLTLNFLEGLRYVADCKRKMPVNESSKMQEYYMFCDQDDVWMPDKIDKTYKRMLKLEHRYSSDTVAAVFTDAEVVDEQLRMIYPSFFQSSKLDTKKRDLSHILMENKLIGCTVMVNEALVKKITILPTKARYHDWWIALLAASFGQISYLPETTIHYRQHSNNMVGNQDFLGYVKKRLSSLQMQKEALHKTMIQADEFYGIYHKELPERAKILLSTFAHLEQYNWICRRWIIIKYGYQKTGILRNIGLFFLI